MKLNVTHRRIRFRAGALSIIMAASALLIGGVPAQGAERTIVTFSYLWGGNGPEGKAIDAVIADFNKSQSTIQVVGISSPDFQKQLTSMSSSNGSFDISDHFGNNVGSWAAKGILEPLDGYLAENKIDLKAFAPAALEQMRYKGKLYSLPIASHTQQLLYNKDLLAAAGIKPPKTMTQLAAAINKLTKKDSEGKITTLGLGIPDASTLLTTLGQAFGGAWDGKANNTPTPTDPNNIKALNWYTKNVTKRFGASNLRFQKWVRSIYVSPGSFLHGQDSNGYRWRVAGSKYSKSCPSIKLGSCEYPGL